MDLLSRRQEELQLLLAETEREDNDTTTAPPPNVTDHNKRPAHTDNFDETTFEAVLTRRPPTSMRQGGGYGC